MVSRRRFRNSTARAVLFSHDSLTRRFFTAIVLFKHLNCENGQCFELLSFSFSIGVDKSTVAINTEETHGVEEDGIRRKNDLLYDNIT